MLRKLVVTLAAVCLAGVVLAPATPGQDLAVTGGFRVTGQGTSSPGLTTTPTRQDHWLSGTGHLEIASAERGFVFLGQASLTATAQSDLPGDSILFGTGSFNLSLTSNSLLPGGGTLTAGGSGRYNFTTREWVAFGEATIVYQSHNFEVDFTVKGQSLPHQSFPPYTSFEYEAWVGITFKW